MIRQIDTLLGMLYGALAVHYIGVAFTLGIGLGIVFLWSLVDLTLGTGEKK